VGLGGKELGLHHMLNLSGNLVQPLVDRALCPFIYVNWLFILKPDRTKEVITN